MWKVIKYAFATKRRAGETALWHFIVILFVFGTYAGASLTWGVIVNIVALWFLAIFWSCMRRNANGEDGCNFLNMFK